MTMVLMKGTAFRDLDPIYVP